MIPLQDSPPYSPSSPSDLSDDDDKKDDVNDNKNSLPYEKSQPPTNANVIVIVSDDDDLVDFNRTVHEEIEAEQGKVEGNVVVNIDEEDDLDEEEIKPNIAAADLQRYNAKVIEDDEVIVQ